MLWINEKLEPCLLSDIIILLSAEILSCKYMVCTSRGRLLDGEWRAASKSDPWIVSQGNTEARCSFFWQGDFHRRSDWEIVWRHHTHSWGNRRKSKSVNLTYKCYPFIYKTQICSKCILHRILVWSIFSFIVKLNIAMFWDYFRKYKLFPIHKFTWSISYCSA